MTITREEKEMFDYLNKLRDSGVTNMFGAAPYLMDEFDIKKGKATTILQGWMKNFNEEGYEDLVED